MIRKWLWNVWIAFGVAILVGLLSFSTNPLSTSFIRAGYGFIIAFLWVMVVRWLLFNVVGIGAKSATQESSLGNQLDLTAEADDQELQQILQQHVSEAAAQAQASDGEQFSPMKWKNIEDDAANDPQRLVQAVRHMSEEEGR